MCFKKRLSQKCYHSQSVGNLTSPLTEEELGVALDKLKCGKADERTGILPEMILAGGKQLWSRLHQLILEVWEEHRVVTDWLDAQIVPIPKKGDLHQCDNWRVYNTDHFMRVCMRKLE